MISVLIKICIKCIFQKILNNHCPKFFPPLAMASYNDESVRCRRLTTVALKSLIGKVSVAKTTQVDVNVHLGKCLHA